MDKLRFNTFIIILSLMLIFKLNTDNDYTSKNSILSKKISLLFEIVIQISIIILIIYCILNKNYINGVVLFVALIEHIIQLIYSYRQIGRGLKNKIAISIYIILILYNYSKENLLFILIWSSALIMHLLTFIYNKPLLSISFK